MSDVTLRGQTMKYAVIIAAGGNGGRMGLKYNKMFFPLATGKTILETSVELFKSDPRCTQIIVVTNPVDIEKLPFKEDGRITLALGGKTRQESVYHGLLKAKEELVLVHDGARPWCTRESIDDLLAAMVNEKAGILAVAEIETIKEVENGYIKQTIRRDRMMHAQTPQAFDRELLLKCHRDAEAEGYSATDDAQLIERYSDTPIRIVEGNYANVKITTMNDVVKHD